ncbi:cell surface glycoprotein CD200 receptor 1-B-like isoform X2 [Hyla sarda]|uniref:cell surface glycoprotein CD200 receptor 1-B-like isoform X2 n=1 Tax=Hyla sarda TaxID=327740 RepID=UPI0024C27349|nr:cell surface glycoprotein CD200 receptor 1-B-like isoform X2 [Hyla sarda]
MQWCWLVPIHLCNGVHGDIFTTQTARVEDDEVLHCQHSTENFIMVTWKGNFLNQPSCYLSNNRSITYGNCSNRMRVEIDKNETSLRIDKCTVFDEGNYTCEIVNKTGTFIHIVALNLLAEPFILVKTNENGYPECQAIRGKPAANISWIPKNPNTVTSQEIIIKKNTTITVISSYNSTNFTDVTCIVSHPTFKSSIERHFRKRPPSESNQLIVILGVIAFLVLFVLLLGIILFWKRSDLRTCFSMNKESLATPDNPVFEEEVEPYASFTEKVNTIYSYGRDPAEYKGADQTGEKTYRRNHIA